MRYLAIITAILFLFTSNSIANSADESSYSSYNNIVSDLHNQLKTKTETTRDKLLQSSYSLSAGLNVQMQKVKNVSESLVGFGVELGIYNFIQIPIKFGLEYANSDDSSDFLFKAKTDHSVYRYNLIDVKLGLAAGIGSFSLNSKDYTSFYITPSIAGFYQIHKLLDLSLNLDYSFHGSDSVSSHFSPSLNAVTYF